MEPNCIPSWQQVCDKIDSAIAGATTEPPQEIFGQGDTWTGDAPVTVQDGNNNPVTVNPGDSFPADMQGCVFLDEVSNTPKYHQGGLPDGYHDYVTIPAGWNGTDDLVGRNGETIPASDVPAGAGPGTQLGVDFDADGNFLEAVCLESLRCVKVPNDAFDDICAETPQLNQDALDWIDTDPTPAPVWYSNDSTAGEWVKTKDGVHCKAPPATIVECGWGPWEAVSFVNSRSQFGENAAIQGVSAGPYAGAAAIWEVVEIEQGAPPAGSEGVVSGASTTFFNPGLARLRTRLLALPEDQPVIGECKTVFGWWAAVTDISVGHVLAVASGAANSFPPFLDTLPNQTIGANNTAIGYLASSDWAVDSTGPIDVFSAQTGSNNLLGIRSRPAEVGQFAEFYMDATGTPDGRDNVVLNFGMTRATPRIIHRDRKTGEVLCVFDAAGTPATIGFTAEDLTQ